MKELLTSDAIIRRSLKEKLEIAYQNTSKRIIEELCIDHGTARVDVAVINGYMHGYEIKSDRDTLHRLPKQMELYNSVFDKMTLVLGKSHLYDAINIVPDWWGIQIAKIDQNGKVVFTCIRESENNVEQDSVCLARLLWKHEALQILESLNQAGGLYYKPRSFAYEKLADVLDKDILSDKVKEILYSRSDWRVDQQLVLNGG